ncbi:MAG TPA: hypothetical protein VFW23_15935 [Tepidisphaeraceae bacterium]|nr:hypothetical protein [Tepidisphaeraceae bacterium]
MNPDDFQKAWQAQSAQPRVTINADLLLKEVQRNQREFRSVVFLRDFREVAVALLLIPVWFYMGAKLSSPWTWYLTVPVLIWIAGFMLVYRIRHKPQSGKLDDSLLHCVERSLTEITDQIWLLRNILWWYLLPLGVSLLAFTLQFAWLHSHGWVGAVAGAAPIVIILFAVYAFIYWLNQFAVRTKLEPRRQELLALIASLREETTSGN